ncbi:MAG TPA: GNAT family N-acetyltransferase, partial [Burkholderiaceae bacterium]|nr:GNAT family N-acetyltransferase [Burkholderiaceae bacterium]
DEARAQDAPAIAAVHVASWRAAYRGLIVDAYLDGLSADGRERMWRDLIEEGRTSTLVARCAGRVCGFAAFGASRDADAASGTAELIALYLDPAHWSRGVGRRLWRAVRQSVVAQGFLVVTLWVLADNWRAIHFYEAAGFVAEIGSRKWFKLGAQRLEELRYARATQ